MKRAAPSPKRAKILAAINGAQMAEGTSLINLGDLSKPATVLIEKVSNAIGVIYEPMRIKRKAAAEAVAQKTLAIADIEVSELQRRAIERLVHQEGRKQENIEKITMAAATAMPADANPDKLDEDWISHFFDQCANVSEAEMQHLWSRLLASEATAPGTISKRTVNLVATLDRSDADLFSSLCQFTWLFSGPVPVVVDTEAPIYKDQGINFEVLNHLASLGLISFEPTAGYRQQTNANPILSRYFDEVACFAFEGTEMHTLDIGKVLLTAAGRQLFPLCGARKNPAFVEYMAKHWSEGRGHKTMAMFTPYPRIQF